MGFGTLFAGYFLLLNFSYYRFTDAICAIIMLYALYKLSGVNAQFKLASFGAAVLTFFGLYELSLAALEMLGIIGSNAMLNSISALIRHFIVATTTALLLLGIRDVASEVGLPHLAKKANYLSYVTLGVYCFNIFLEAGDLASFLDPRLLVYLAVLSIISTLALVCVNLSVIFNAYYSICMPEDRGVDFVEKKSKFGLVNAFRAHQEEKQKEYAEYKINKMKKKAEKLKQKSNNNERK